MLLALNETISKEESPLSGRDSIRGCIILMGLIPLCCGTSLWTIISLASKVGWGWTLGGLTLVIGFIGVRFSRTHLDKSLLQLKALSHLNMAEKLLSHPLNATDDDLEQAIYHAKQAQIFYTRQTLPYRWAQIQMVLGKAYVLRIKGERADNIEQAIFHGNQALQVYTRQAFPYDWAIMQNSLGTAYVSRIKGKRADNIELAISHFELALQVTRRHAFSDDWPRTHSNIEFLVSYIKLTLQGTTTRRGFPHDWAKTQLNLAAAYVLRIRGERADNIERAIEHCKQALQVCTREAFPAEWAMTMNNLAGAYLYRIRGERADNLEEAIKHARQALTVYTRQAFPQMWATTVNNLAGAYLYRIWGTKADNLEEAIRNYRQTLTVYTRQTFPPEWARTMNNLAGAYLYRIRGARADNLEEAIKHATQALTVYTRQTFPAEWAGSTNNLAAAYLGRIRGERADNLEEAIKHATEALTVYTHQAFPEKWAETMNNLALAYSDRIRGVRADNLEEAISHYTQALTVYTRQAFPAEWALTMNSLAAAYENRIRGVRADNLEEAIKHATQALTVRTPQAFPEKWALTMNNLANAYQKRIRGAKADNLEEAIRNYRQALTVVTHEAFPAKWAMVMNNLANAYQDRIRGTRADNLEEAISHYTQALTVRTGQAFPADWATTMNNLGKAYHNRIRGEKADNLEEAISHYTQALTVRTRQAFPPEWAESMNNLANAYGMRIRGVRADNLEEAIRNYRQALTVYTRQAFPTEWARSMNNLAIVYFYRIRGERADNIEMAISYCRQALLEYTPLIWPLRCRDVANRLGRLLYDEGRFAEAREAFVTAHEAVEVLRGEGQREGTRRKLAEEYAGLYARLVFCCLHEGDEEVAFEYAAASKGRAFVDLLASQQINLTNLPDELQKKVDKANNLKSQQDAVLAFLTGESPSLLEDTLSSDERQALQKQLQEELQRLRGEENELWEDIRFEYPDYFATQAAPSFTLAEAQALASGLDATLVEFYRHAEGWVAFVIRPDEASLVVVPLSVTNEELNKWFVEYYNGLEKRANRNMRRLEYFYQALIIPLQAHLPTADTKLPARLVLAPFSGLHLLPLAALRVKIKRGEYRYLGEEYVVSVVPNLALLKRMVEKRRYTRERLCAVAYPGASAWKNHPDKELRSKYLNHVLPEVKAIANGFPKSKTLLEANATPQAAINHGPSYDVVHYSCHGTFTRSDVDHSGLLLAGGWLRLRDIFNELRLPDAALAVLSACVTGRAELRGGDELAGLVQAFMYAGAPSVIASLWAVNDAATRYLFERFYLYYTKGVAAAEALRVAQQEMRERGYTHAYFWAAFQPLGAVYDTIQGSASLPTLQVTPVEQMVPLYVPPSKRSKRRGDNRMSIPQPDEILDDARMLVDNMAEDAEIIRDELLTPAEQAAFQGTLRKLAAQAIPVSSDSELLALALAIVSEVEAVPALCDEFVGDAESDVRALSLEAFEKSGKSLTKSDEERVSITNELRTKIEAIALALLPPADEDEQNRSDQQEQNS